MLSAFGVDHGYISKSNAPGSTESMLDIEHRDGKHEGKSFRRCPKCHPNAWKTVKAVPK